MARTTPRPTPTVTQTLLPMARHCPCCGTTMWAAYHNSRTLTTLEAVLRLTLQIRRCLNTHCPQFRKPYRPEVEGRLALPKHEFGLDVIAFVGTRRYAQHRSIPEIHQALLERGVVVAQRTVTNLLERYDELLSLRLQDTSRLRRLTAPQGRVILALDGLQPDMGHEVLWVFRDCLSGEVLLAQSLLSASHKDLAALLRQVKQALRVPIVAVVSDGQRSIRKAVHHALPHVPHQLCHFPYLREAAKPIYEADRHAKKELKKRVRGVRPIERPLDTRTDPEANVSRGYCRAVRMPSPPMAARLYRPQASRSMLASVRLRTRWRGSKKGGLAHGPAPAAAPHPPGLSPDGCAVAPGPGRLSLGETGGRHTGQCRSAPWQRGETPPASPARGYGPLSIPQRSAPRRPARSLS